MLVYDGEFWNNERNGPGRVYREVDGIINGEGVHRDGQRFGRWKERSPGVGGLGKVTFYTFGGKST